jgi:hypothetical protein
MILNYALLKAMLIPFFTCLIDEIEILFLSKPLKGSMGWNTTVAFTQLIFKKCII